MNSIGNINRVKNVVVIKLLMIIFVKGFWILVLMLLDSNIGIRFSVDVIVVINIGCSFDVVLLNMVLDIDNLFVMCWLMFFIIIILFRIVILNKVIKFMEFGIERYCFDN